jgi:hypothetical protein
MSALQPEILAACRLLFGRPGGVSFSFLADIEPDSLKSAFRKMALQTHPDRALALGKNPGQMEAEFRRVVAAFDLLSAHLEKGKLWIPPGARDPGKATAKANPKPNPKPKAPPPREPSTPPRRPASSPPPGKKARPGGPGNPGAKDEPRRDQTREPRQEARQGAFDFGDSPSRQPRVTRFWKGPLPERYLKLGQFLFFSGLIPARELIDAIWWQRRQRPVFGQIARDWGILTAEQVVHILSRRLQGETFGEAAMRLGCMTGFEQLAVAARQKNLQRPLGQFFLENGILRAPELEEEIFRQRRHNLIFR